MHSTPILAFIQSKFSAYTGPAQSGRDVYLALRSVPGSIVLSDPSHLSASATGIIDLVFVDSLGSHAEYLAHREAVLDAFSVLIVRESPRHFGVHNPQGRSFRWAKAAFAYYDAYVFVSSRCRDEWTSLGVTGRKLSFYAPNCIREDQSERLVRTDRASLRRTLGLPLRGLIAICVASFQQRKGQDLLLDIFASVKDAAPNLLLRTLGAARSPWGQMQIKKATKSFSKDLYRHLGPQPDAIRFIRAADILVLPSRAEALPRVILEAMAVGTPVLASRVDGVPELIIHGVSGLLFNPEDLDDFSSNFIRIATDTSTRRRFATRAYSRYWTHFCRHRYTDRYIEIVRQVLRLRGKCFLPMD